MGVRRLVAALRFWDFGYPRLALLVTRPRSQHPKTPKGVTSHRTPYSKQNGRQSPNSLSCASRVPNSSLSSGSSQLLARLLLRLLQTVLHRPDDCSIPRRSCAILASTRHTDSASRQLVFQSTDFWKTPLVQTARARERFVGKPLLTRTPPDQGLPWLSSDRSALWQAAK